MAETPSTAIATRDPVERDSRGQAIIAVYPADSKDGHPVAAIIKTTQNGLIRNMMTRVPLKVANGELWELVAWVPPKDRGGSFEKKVTLAITAAGYYKLNQFIGVSFLSPQTVLGDDGAEHSNPWICRDENGEIVFVRVRRIGIGRNPQGNLVAWDYTLTFDLGNYFKTDLFSKWSGKKKAPVPMEWGKLLPAQMKPTPEQLGNPKGIYQSYHMPGNAKLWVDFTDREVQQVLQEHLNKQRNAERNAQTMCERNILLRFVATRVVRADGTVPVVGWVDADRNFERIANKVGVTADGKVEIDGQVIDTQRGDERVSDADEVDGILTGEGEPEDVTPGDEDDGGPVIDVDPAEPAPTESPDLPKLREKIRGYVQDLGASSDEVAEAMSGQGFNTLGDVADCQDATKLGAALDQLETAKLRRVQAAKTKPKSEPPAGNGGSLLPDDKPMPRVEAPAKKK